MQCSAVLRLPAAQRASSVSARRPARRVALRAVAFRTDSEPTPTPTTTSFNADAARDLLTAKTTEATGLVMAQATDIATTLQTKWEESDNKPAIVATGIASLFGLYIVNGVVSTIDRLPLLHSMFELLGVGVAAWFAYKWFFVAGEREAMTSEIKAFTKDIGL